MPLFSGASNVVYLVPCSERIGAVRDVKHAFQVKPPNSVVLIVNVCSAMPVVFSLAFKMSAVVAIQ